MSESFYSDIDSPTLQQLIQKRYITHIEAKKLTVFQINNLESNKLEKWSILVYSLGKRHLI